MLQVTGHAGGVPKAILERGRSVEFPSEGNDILHVASMHHTVTSHINILMNHYTPSSHFSSPESSFRTPKLNTGPVDTPYLRISRSSWSRHGGTYTKMWSIQRRLAWPLHANPWSASSFQGRPWPTVWSVGLVARGCGFESLLRQICPRLGWDPWAGRRTPNCKKKTSLLVPKKTRLIFKPKRWVETVG